MITKFNLGVCGTAQLNKKRSPCYVCTNGYWCRLINSTTEKPCSIARVLLQFIVCINSPLWYGIQ